MNIIVRIKRVPETAEADILIDKSGKDIDKSGLVFDRNEWGRSSRCGPAD